jgi:hypothetical protein
MLKQSNIRNTIDLLSIDVDGDDYYIFQSLKYLRPRVIICEFHPTMPAHIDLYPKYHNYTGCSVAALVYIVTAYDGTYLVIQEKGTLLEGKIDYGITSPYTDTLNGSYDRLAHINVQVLRKTNEEE